MHINSRRSRRYRGTRSIVSPLQQHAVQHKSCERERERAALAMMRLRTHRTARPQQHDEATKVPSSLEKQNFIIDSECEMPVTPPVEPSFAQTNPESAKMVMIAVDLSSLRLHDQECVSRHLKDHRSTFLAVIRYIHCAADPVQYSRIVQRFSSL
jgi:hypothetical protein